VRVTILTPFRQQRWQSYLGIPGYDCCDVLDLPAVSEDTSLMVGMVMNALPLVLIFVNLGARGGWQCEWSHRGTQGVLAQDGG